MRDLKTFIEKYAALLPVGTSISFTDAERRASEFLTAQATITDFRHLLTTERIKCLTVQTAVFAQQMSKGAGKTVTQDKLNAEASDEYIHAREDLENIENDLAYLRAYYDIFNNAHIFYRNMAKGENV
jgi:hypothetical protein